MSPFSATTAAIFVSFLALPSTAFAPHHTVSSKRNGIDVKKQSFIVSSPNNFLVKPKKNKFVLAMGLETLETSNIVFITAIYLGAIALTVKTNESAEKVEVVKPEPAVVEEETPVEEEVEVEAPVEKEEVIVEEQPEEIEVAVEETAEEIIPDPPKVDIVAKKKAVASTLQGEKEKSRRLTESEPVEETIEESVEEIFESEVEENEPELKKKSWIVKRVVKKIIMPWKKFSNIQ